jgi:hypothetical protein
MPAYKKKIDFRETAEGIAAHAILQDMEASPTYNTSSSYTANTHLHPDNTISFTDKHIEYLMRHQNTNVNHYIANLKLITRIR